MCTEALDTKRGDKRTQTPRFFNTLMELRNSLLIFFGIVVSSKKVDAVKYNPWRL